MAKAYTLGLYEKAMPKDLSWKEKMLAAKGAGFDFIEISIDETDEKLARRSVWQRIWGFGSFSWPVMMFIMKKAVKRQESVLRKI